MSVATEPIHTLDDLEKWSFAGTALAVIGHPIAHSLSPEMHNAALAELAKTNPQFSQWHYFKFDINAGDELAGALRGFRENHFLGLNLTVPHKAMVVPHLDFKHARVEEAGAANTLKLTEQGWHGYNTDGAGLSDALREDLAVSLAGTHVVLLGAGGAARAAAVECLRSGCASLWIGNRTQVTRESLIAGLKKSPAFALQPDRRLEGFDPKNPPTALPAESLVINATSLGLKPDDASPLNLEKIPRPAKVFDMIYRPSQTALLRQAAALGVPHANGLSMLVHQGAKSLALWTGETAPVEIMNQAARVALQTN
jgi:shikimate dehydrogenase